MNQATLDIAPPGFIKLINQVTSKDPAKRPATAAEFVQKLLKVRADAQWPALLNRKSRLDLNVMWSTDLLQKMKVHLIADEDLIFILQGVEDHLITEKDIRLKSGQPIDVEESVITQTLNAFKSARYEAAMARHARLKTDMLAAAANPTIKTERPTLNTKTQSASLMGTPPPAIAPIDKNVISDRIRATNGTQSRKIPINESSGSSSVFMRLFTGALFIALTFGIFSFFTEKFREVIGTRLPAENGEAVLITSPSQSRVNEILKHFTALKPGLRLVYDARVMEKNKPTEEIQDRRDLFAIQKDRLLWMQNERKRVSTSVLALPLDVFFFPISQLSENTIAESSNILSPENIEVGQLNVWKIKDTATGIVENTLCRTVLKTPTKFQEQDQILWRIECDREAVDAAGVLTHRTKESYDYLSSGIVTNYEINVDEFKTGTSPGRQYLRTGTLNTTLSTFKN